MKQEKQGLEIKQTELKTAQNQQDKTRIKKEITGIKGRIYSLETGVMYGSKIHTQVKGIDPLKKDAVNFMFCPPSWNYKENRFLNDDDVTGITQSNLLKNGLFKRSVDDKKKNLLYFMPNKGDLCMVCCGTNAAYRQAYTISKNKCLGLSQERIINTTGDIKYILKVNGKTPSNRLSVLPDKLNQTINHN